MSLDAQIKKSALQIATDSYDMSVGELINIYRDGDLIVNPEFQRLFRWDAFQKSHLIESLLIGVPLPSIFVFELSGGKWELIDGLQRVSTILEFVGILKHEMELPTRRHAPRRLDTYLHLSTHLGMAHLRIASQSAPRSKLP